MIEKVQKFKDRLIIEKGIAYVPTISHYSPHEVIEEHKYNRPVVAKSLISLLATNEWQPVGLDTQGWHDGLHLIYNTHNSIEIVLFYLDKQQVVHIQQEYVD